MQKVTLSTLQKKIRCILLHNKFFILQPLCKSTEWERANPKKSLAHKKKLFAQFYKFIFVRKFYSFFQRRHGYFIARVCPCFHFIKMKKRNSLSCRIVPIGENLFGLMHIFVNSRCALNCPFYYLYTKVYCMKSTSVFYLISSCNCFCTANGFICSCKPLIFAFCNAAKFRKRVCCL